MIRCIICGADHTVVRGMGTIILVTVGLVDQIWH